MTEKKRGLTFEDIEAVAAFGNHLYADQIDINEVRAEAEKATSGFPDDPGVPVEVDDPDVAPGMAMNDSIEAAATPDDIDNGEYTDVTRLYLDRTPED